MNSSKQRRQEIKAQRLAKRTLAKTAAQRAAEADRRRAMETEVQVEPTALAPDGSYGVPDFVQRGYYLDLPFTCKECSKAEIWTAIQQKWWYEVVKGSVWTTALRCRPCRQRERERRNEARRVHLEGLARKQGNPETGQAESTRD